MALLKGIEELYNKFSLEVYNPRYLDMKTKELVAFSNAALIDCKHCMNRHYKAALEAGETSEEISEVIAIAMTVSAGKVRGVAKDTIWEIKENEK